MSGKRGPHLAARPRPMVARLWTEFQKVPEHPAAGRRHLHDSIPAALAARRLYVAASGAGNEHHAAAGF